MFLALHGHTDSFTLFLPLAGVRDSSGMVFTYTATKRQHDAGYLGMGHLVFRSHIIPPNATSYSTYAVCPSECTKEV